MPTVTLKVKIDEGAELFDVATSVVYIAKKLDAYIEFDWYGTELTVAPWSDVDDTIGELREFWKDTRKV